MDVKVEELHHAFKKFGTIKQCGVKTTSDYMNNRCFAFIEIQSSSSTQTAIQASSITIENPKVHMEEKKISNGLLTHSTGHNGSLN